MYALQTSRKSILIKQKVYKNMLLARCYLQHSMPQNSEETLHNSAKIKLF